MKSFRSTFVLIGLVAAIGGFAVWDYFQTQKNEETEKQNSLILNLSEDEVKKLVLRSEEGTFTLERSSQSEDFSIVSPITDEVDQDTIRFWLNDVFNESAKPLRSGSEVKWSDFDLEEPKRSLEVQTFSQENFLIFVSQQSAFDGSIYLRKEDQLLLGGTAWGRLMLKKTNEVRGKKLLRKTIDLKKLESIEIESADMKTTYSLTRNVGGEGWALSPQVSWPLSSAEVESFVRSLEGTRTEGYLNDAPTEAEIKSYGLKKGASQLTLNFASQNQEQKASENSQGQEKKDSDQLIIKLAPRPKGQSEASFAMLVSDRPFIYSISKKSFEQLLPALQNFRDKDQPFNVDLALADRLILESKNLPAAVIAKKDGAWSLNPPSNDLKLNESKRDLIFKKMQSLKVKDFKPLKTLNKAQAPSAKVKIYAGDELLIELSWQQIKPDLVIAQSSRAADVALEVDDWRIKEIEEQWPIELNKKEEKGKEKLKEENSVGSGL